MGRTTLEGAILNFAGQNEKLFKDWELSFSPWGFIQKTENQMKSDKVIWYVLFN